MATNVASIVATLNPTQAIAGMRALTAKLGGLKGSILAVGTAFTAAAAVAAVSFAVASVKAFASAGDEIQKMALRTGFATETLSEFKHAADLSGASLAAVETAVKRMQRTVLDAELGLSTAIDAFELLGVALEDVEGKTPEQQFEVLAMALADVEDATKRAAIAQMIFGRAGTQLLPMLAAGREGIAAMRAEAHELGLVFSQQAADDAAQFNDELTRLGSAFKGLQYAVGAELVPALIPLIQRMTEMALLLNKVLGPALQVIAFVYTNMLIKKWNGLVLVTKVAVTVLKSIGELFVILAKKIPFVGDAVSYVTDNWRELVQVLVEEVDRALTRVESMINSMIEHFTSLIEKIPFESIRDNFDWITEMGEVKLPRLQVETEAAAGSADTLNVAAEELGNTMAAAAAQMKESETELHPTVQRIRDSIKAWEGHTNDLDLAMIEAYEATTDLGHGGNMLADSLNRASDAEKKRTEVIKKATEDQLAAAARLMQEGNRMLGRHGVTNAYFDHEGNLQMLPEPEAAPPPPIDPNAGIVSFGSIGAPRQGVGHSFDRLVQGRVTLADVRAYEKAHGLTAADKNLIVEVSIDGTGFIISDEEKMGEVVAQAINKAAVAQGAIITNEATGAVV